MAAIRLEDLIQAQNKLKQDEAKKTTTETMSIEEFKKLTTEMGDTNPGTTTKALIKKGLHDKTGDGLNANVVKLTKVIKDATEKKGNIAGTPVAAGDITPAGRVAGASVDVDVARRARLEGTLEKRQMGGIGYLKQQFDVPEQLKGMEAVKTGIVNKLKGMFNLENWFDLQKGKSEGFTGQVIRRRAARSKYAEERMAGEVEAGRMVDTKENRKAFRKQFERQQENIVEVQANIKERNRLEKAIASGYDTPAMRKKLAATATQEEALDKRMAKDDLAYRVRKKADEANPIEIAPAKKAKAVRSPSTGTSESLKVATAEAEKMSTDESEAETNRMVGDQTNLLKQIEENTRSLKDLPAKLAVPVAAAGAAETEGGGLGNMLGKNPLGRLGGSLKRVGGSWLGKVGGAAKLAKGVGLGAVGTLAGEGIQAGGEALKEAGWEQTGKAVGVAGTATKYAGYGAMIGSVIPGVGTAIGAGVGGLLGAGKGIYDQYFGEESKAKPIEKAPATRQYEVSGVTSDDVVNHPNYKKYYEQSLNGRTGPEAEHMARRAASIKVTGDIARSKAEGVTPSPKAADTVYNQSGENAAAARKSSELGAAPVIVNAPTNVNNTSNYAPKSPPRNTDSSLQQYNRSKYAMST